MYKVNFLAKTSRVSAIVIIATIVGLIGCQKESNFDAIDKELQIVENNVISNNISVKKNLMMSQDNVNFFNALAQYSKEEDRIKLKNGDSQNIQGIEESLKSYPFKKGDILSDAETKVLKSFFNTINKEKNTVLVIQFYIEQVEKMSLDSFSKKRCLSFLTLLRDAYFFMYSNNVEKSISPRLKSGSESSDSGFWESFVNGVSNFESCTDRCMYNKLDAIFNQGNWIDKASFVAGAPINVVVMYASCSWDCF